MTLFCASEWLRAFFGTLHAKDSNDDRGIAIDLDGRLFRDGLRGLVIGRLDAGEKLAFGRKAAVAVDRDHGVGEEHVESPCVLLLQGVVPSFFQAQDSPSLIAIARLLRPAQAYAQQN